MTLTSTSNQQQGNGPFYIYYSISVCCTTLIKGWGKHFMQESLYQPVQPVSL